MAEQQREPKLSGHVDAIYEFEGYPLMGYCVRGYVDPAEMVAAIEYDYGDRYDAAKVKQTYARNVPVGRDRPGEMVIYTDVRPGRGAYEITWLEAW